MHSENTMQASSVNTAFFKCFCSGACVQELPEHGVYAALAA